MSVIESGTRTSANGQRTVRPSSRHIDRSCTRDKGMSKLVLAQAVVFTQSPPQVTAAGAFAAFGSNDTIIVEGTNLNNGFFTVTAAASGALTLDPPPSGESAAACTIRAQ